MKAIWASLAAKAAQADWGGDGQAACKEKPGKAGLKADPLRGNNDRTRITSLDQAIPCPLVYQMQIQFLNADAVLDTVLVVIAKFDGFKGVEMYGGAVDALLDMRATRHGRNNIRRTGHGGGMNNLGGVSR
mgnify:CR=1 FL=1